MAIIDGLLADLAAEGDDLDRVVSGIGHDQWQLATPAPGWTIAHQIVHLASSDRLATLAATGSRSVGAGPAGLTGSAELTAWRDTDTMRAIRKLRMCLSTALVQVF